MRTRLITTGLLIAVIAAPPAAFASESWLKDPVGGCELWSKDGVSPGDSVTWTGDCVDGKASGEGVGVWHTTDGLLARFEGAMRAGKATGAGEVVFRAPDDTGYWHFAGQFEDGVPVGEGELLTDTGYRFRGEVLDGLVHLRGTVVTPDGSTIRGEFKNGETVGVAFAFFEDGDETYLGEILNGQRHGKGSLLLDSENVYFGEFFEGKASGYGIFLENDGEDYVGAFEDGTPNGFGTVVAVDGRTIQGRFVDGKPDGLVLVTGPDGTQSTENWANGEKAQ